MSDSSLVPAPIPEPAPAPSLPEDSQARQIALLEKIVEQQAALLVAAQAQTRVMSKDGSMPVRVVDFHMRFWSIANLLVMSVLAAIPAGILIGLLWLVATMALAIIGAALTR